MSKPWKEALLSSAVLFGGLAILGAIGMAVAALVRWTHWFPVAIGFLLLFIVALAGIIDEVNKDEAATGMNPPGIT